MIASIVPRQYLVSQGASGGFGRFQAAPPLVYQRGDEVVVRSQRGVELGQVLWEITAPQCELLKRIPLGEILRTATEEDLAHSTKLRSLAEELFQRGRLAARELQLPLEILDVQVLLDGQRAIAQHVGKATGPLDELAARMAGGHQITIFFENLNEPGEAVPEEAGGCGKPDCGWVGGGCSTCSTGGCSSCGSSGVDLRQYFAHLRSKMEENQRVSLL